MCIGFFLWRHFNFLKKFYFCPLCLRKIFNTKVFCFWENKKQKPTTMKKRHYFFSFFLWTKIWVVVENEKNRNRHRKEITKHYLILKLIWYFFPFFSCCKLHCYFLCVWVGLLCVCVYFFVEKIKTNDDQTELDREKLN